MLHTRIKRWKLGRNHKFPEMRTAAHLLAKNLDRQLPNQRTGSPCFMIRGELVDHSEFLRYFRRKKINDPVEWVRLQHDEFVLSEDAKLITGTTTPESNAADDDQPVRDTNHADSDDSVYVEHQHSSPVVLVDNSTEQQQPSDIEARRFSPNTQNPCSIALPTFLRPQIFYILEHLTYTVSAYISSYTASPRSLTHTEPAVHSHTVHAMFASRMQDGISLLLLPASASHDPEGSTSRAFNSFQKAFDMISQILSNDHPMSLALVLTVICELARHTNTAFKGLITQLLKYTTRMSSLVLGSTHAIATFFFILGQHFAHTDPFTLANMVLTSLRLATAHLSTHNPYDWKTLYLRERLCDGLYHSGPDFQSERSLMRARLLADQERLYGLNARNVVWTLTNVADDAFEQGQLEAATQYYRQALERADTSEGYGRAKTRFAALEGLGRCEVREAEVAEEAELRARVVADCTATQDMQYVSKLLHSSSAQTCCKCSCHSTSNSTSNGSSTEGTGQSTPTSSSSSKSQLNQREKHLQKALEHFMDAETEACLWFEESSRRTTKVKRSIEQVKELLGLVEV